MFRTTVSAIIIAMLLTSMLTLAFKVQPATARTIVVPDDYSTIQQAVDAAITGDTVYVRAGTYHERVVITKALSLVGEDRAITIIDGSGWVYAVVTGDYVTVTGFTIRGNIDWVGIAIGGRYCNVSGNNVESCHHGIQLVSYPNNTVVRNNVVNNHYGIFLSVSSGNNVAENTVTNNSYGIYLSGSDHNIIAGNTVIANKEVGIMLVSSSDYNSLVGNEIANDKYGIMLDSSYSNNDNYNNVIGNNITDNYVGASFYYSGNNRFYHNNFINNTIQANPLASSSLVWDDGYPSGGNYWSDYTDEDLSWGPYQNETGSDGIWDHPYAVSADSLDHYPLASPWNPLLHGSSALRIVGHTVSLNPVNSVSAVVNVTMLSQFSSSARITCNLVLVDTTGKEVYNNFAGLGGPQDDKNTFIENNTITSVEFTFQLQQPRPGKYAYAISIWSFDKGEMYDSSDWILAFDVQSEPIYVLDLGTLYANSYIQDNPLVLFLRRFESINYTFRLAESVTDLSVKVFTLPNSEFRCTLNASNAQMDLHGEILPHFNVWHNVPANIYEMNLEMESVGANLVRVVIQAGPSIETPSVKIIGVEPTSILSTPGGIITYKIDVGFNVTTYDYLVLTATLDGQVFNRTYAVEPFKSNVITAYLQVDAPSEIGQYIVNFNASLLSLGIFDTATAPLNVDSAIYNITISPTVRYYQERLRLDFWKGPRRYVSDTSKLNALDVTNIRISSVDERDSQTGKPSMVSISFDAANKEKDIHHIVQVKIGSDTYTLGTVIYGDEPRRMEAHNIPVINDKVSFTITYRKWTFGNWFAEVGTKSAKAIIDWVLPTVAPGCSAIWFATGDIATQLAKYTILYAEQNWMEQENGYMTIDDATRIIESSGIQQSDFLQFLTAAIKVTHNPFHAFLDTIGFLRESGKMNPWNHARAYIAGFKHILDNAETRLLDIMVKAFGSAALKLGITLVAGEIVKKAFNEVLNAEVFLKALGRLISTAQAIENAWNILVSPSEEGKEVSNAQIGTDPAKEVDPIISMSFDGEVDYTNDTCFGDTLSMNVSFDQTQARVFLEVDCNLTSVYLVMLSDSLCRSGILSSFGFNATHSSLEWLSEDSVFIVEALGSPYDGLIGLQFWMNSSYIQGTQTMSTDAIWTGETAWLNGTLSYPFGKDLVYETNVTLPRGSEIIQILSDGNFTVEDATVTWNTAIDDLAIEFTPPNVATTEIVSAKTVVGQGYCTGMNATVTNNSTCTQTINMTVYATMATIGTQLATQAMAVESKNSTIGVFTWNTTGFAYGNYTLSAYAWPVPGETNTVDNTLVGGSVIVTIPGDLNGDFTVDIYDAILLAGHFNQTPINPLWNANVDINGDNIVDIYDAIILANHYNQHWL